MWKFEKRKSPSSLVESDEVKSIEWVEDVVLLKPTAAHETNFELAQ